jgi:two-component system, cell cycle response regulator DivK
VSAAPRILVVEDDADNRRIVAKVLSVAGYEMLEAAGGEEGVAMALRERPDLVLLDLAMPGVDGWEAARRLKSDPRTADIPVIALTAFALRGDEERARAAGCDGYLAKPCRPQTIRDVVRDTLAGRRTTGGRRTS